MIRKIDRKVGVQIMSSEGWTGNYFLGERVMSFIERAALPLTSQNLHAISLHQNYRAGLMSPLGQPNVF